MTSLAADSHAAVETIFGLAGEAFKGAESLCTLNLQTLKTLMAESQEISRIASSTISPIELMKLQMATVQEAPLKALGYGRQVREVFGAFGAAQRAAYEDGVADAQAKLLEAASGFFKNAPGSKKILTLMQAAVDTSNNAYKRMNTTSKQITDTLAANVTNAGVIAAQRSANALATIEE